MNFHEGTELYFCFKKFRRSVGIKSPVEIWMFPKIGVPQNGWFIMENPIKIDDFGGTMIFGNTHMSKTNPYLG